MTQPITDELIAQICDQLKEERKPKQDERLPVTAEVMQASYMAWGYEYANQHWRSCSSWRDPMPCSYAVARKIAEMQIDECGFTVPWAFNPFTMSLDLYYDIHQASGGGRMPVKRMKEGYYVGKGILVTQAS